MCQMARRKKNEEFEALTEEQVAELSNIVARGVPIKDAARILGISPLQLHATLQQQENVRKKINKSAGSTQIEVSSRLIENAKAGEIAAIKWYETTRLGYSDRNPDFKYIQQEISDLLDYIRNKMSKRGYAELVRIIEAYPYWKYWNK